MAGVPGGDVFLDPDGARDYLRSWKQRVDSMAAATQAMSDRIGQLRATAEDGNGLAEVTVDSTGVLVDLTLTDRIHRFEPDVVSRAVMTALRKARMQAADRSREIAVEALGPDSLSARTIGDRMQRLLEEPEIDDGLPDQGRG
jgi:DNA-binding protein YbaB